MVVAISITNAQDEDKLLSLTIPSELQKDANAVVRYESDVITIEDYNKFKVSSKRIVTVFNEYGNAKHGAYMHYDNSQVIKLLEARIYDAFGKEIKKIKKKDFVDESSVSGGTLYSDSRIKYLDYTPVKYPYTVVFESEIELKSTAHVPSWIPLSSNFTSVEYSEYKVINKGGLEFNVKPSNFEGYNITKLGELHYKAENLRALRNEQYAPSILDYAPKLKVALAKFYYEGYTGETNSWDELGSWMYDKLLVNRTELPEETINMIKELVKEINDPIEKAKVVYKYVQDNTRYISVQEGIGGIQPETAYQVDKVKYGDCKGLTNYTKSLLDAVGVESYYTRLYGSRKLVDIDKDFVTFLGQTNHVILSIPQDDDFIWLECTSQTNPFGYIANFTDDRDVFVVTPNGGKIVHTTVYPTEENIQATKAKVNFDAAGMLKANIVIKTYGTQYGLHDYIEKLAPKKQDLHYKEYWSNINNLTINSIDLKNNKDAIEFVETIDIETPSYGKKSGSRYLIEPNAFNKTTSIPTRYDNRTHDIKIERGWTDVDEFTFTIDEAFEIEALPKPVVLETKFGIYKMSIEQLEGNVLEYKRTYILNNGTYDKSDYEAFRDFRKAIVKHDKSKIVLKRKA